MNINEMKDLWLSKKWNEGDNFNLYIDNPFCINRCNYCIYNPTETKIGSDLFKRYYYDYLPNQILQFKEVLNNHPIDSVYFGGGTASLMPIDVMKDIFNLIPNFKDINYKVYENHPVFTTKEKIDLFAENNFTYLSFGIQSFNEKIIKAENRIHLNENKFKDMIEYIKSKGLKFNCDLLALIDKGEKEDIKILLKDLVRLVKEYEPNIITIYPKYQRINSNYSSANVPLFNSNDVAEASYQKIHDLRKILSHVLENERDYYLDPKLLMLDKKSILDLIKTNYIVMKKEDMESLKRAYTSSGFPHQPANQNVLGLGGYGDRKPYSYFGKERFWHLNNDNFNVNFEEIIM
jgi:radical SAM superfamily enzyme